MSVIIKVFSYFILQVTLLLSILLLLRGHNHPGGGFIGALIACTGIGFYILAHNKLPPFTHKSQIFMVNSGIFCLLASMLLPVLINENILTGLWSNIEIWGYKFKLGSPLLFDIGIYLSILGSLIWILSYLEDETYD